MAQDPYNYAFPQRRDLMSLSTIESGRVKPFSSYVSNTLDVSDIYGAQTKQPLAYIPNHQLSSTIEPHPQNWKTAAVRSDSLRINDIDGTGRFSKAFKTKRVSNPLQPVYQLPEANQLSLLPPNKFIRDTLNIFDIPTRARNRLKARVVQLPQVQGSSPAKPRQQIVEPRRDKFNVKDINFEGTFNTSRNSNPLEPTYRWSDRDDRQLVEYGHPQQFHGRNRHPEVVNKVMDSSLRTIDIEGGRANSYCERAYFLERRRQQKDTLGLIDLPCTQVGSLRKGITTRRNTNPLTPNYGFQYEGTGLGINYTSAARRMQRFISDK